MHSRRSQVKSSKSVGEVISVKLMMLLSGISLFIELISAINFFALSLGEPSSSIDVAQSVLREIEFR